MKNRYLYHANYLRLVPFATVISYTSFKRIGRKNALISIICSLVILFQSSCQRRISRSALEPSETLVQKFNFGVAPYIREETLQANYGEIIQTRKGTGGTGGWFGTDGGTAMAAGLLNIFDGIFGADHYAKDERKNHTRTIIERDFTKNIGQSVGQQKIQAIVSVTSFEEKKAMNPVPMAARIGLGTLNFISALEETPINQTTGKKSMLLPIFQGSLSFGLGSTLVGIPRWRKEKAKVGIEIVLNNNKGNVIGRYTSFGEANIRTGWYFWNYTKINAKHLANMEAVTSAMNNIKQQISRDYNKIVSEVDN